MTNILTAAEAANFVRTDATDPILLMLLPLVDDYILRATGRDWSADNVIHPMAKTAAGMLLALWYDNPQLVGTSSQGTANPLLQLEVEALKYRKYVFYGRNAAGGIHVTATNVEEVMLPEYRGPFWVPGNLSSSLILPQPLRTPPLLVGDVVLKLTGVYGVSGDQHMKFENTISVAHYIQQTDGSDLSGNLYVMVVKNPADDVGT
jgi:hypothetical protein